MDSSLSSVPPVMSEAASGDHRHGESASRCKGSEDQGNLISDAAGGMFIDLWGTDRSRIDDVSRMHHGVRQSRDLLRIHAAQIDGHRKSTHLIVGDPTLREAIDKPADLSFTQDLSIPLTLDDPLRDEFDGCLLRSFFHRKDTPRAPLGRPKNAAIDSATSQ